MCFIFGRTDMTCRSSSILIKLDEKEEDKDDKVIMKKTIDLKSN